MGSGRGWKWTGVLGVEAVAEGVLAATEVIRGSLKLEGCDPGGGGSSNLRGAGSERLRGGSDPRVLASCASALAEPVDELDPAPSPTPMLGTPPPPQPWPMPFAERMVDVARGLGLLMKGGMAPPPTPQWERTWRWAAA